MIDFGDLFHTGIRVPDLDVAMAELGDGLGLDLGRGPREPGADPVDPDRRAPGDPPPLHVLRGGPAAHRTAPGPGRFVLGR